MCADRGWLPGTSVPSEKFTPLSPLSGVTYAAKGYFDALVKMGELASESQGSKELGKMPQRSQVTGYAQRVWSPVLCLVLL